MKEGDSVVLSFFVYSLVLRKEMIKVDNDIRLAFGNLDVSLCNMLCCVINKSPVNISDPVMFTVSYVDVFNLDDTLLTILNELHYRYANFKNNDVDYFVKISYTFSWYDRLINDLRFKRENFYVIKLCESEDYANNEFCYSCKEQSGENAIYDIKFYTLKKDSDLSVAACCYNELCDKLFFGDPYYCIFTDGHICGFGR